MRRSQVGFRAHLAAIAILAAIPFVAGGAAISYLYVTGEETVAAGRTRPNALGVI